MPMAVVKELPKKTARSLQVLEPLIRLDIAAGENAGVPHFASAGEKLWEAKAHFRDTASFYEWATDRFKRSKDTIRKWMIYAEDLHGGEPLSFEEDSKIAPAKFSQPKRYKTLSEVTDPRTTHQPAWFSPVQRATENVNVHRMSQERQDRIKEKELRHKLAMQLIDIGYRVLVAKLHPDKGGSREAMQRLNEVRDILKGAI